MTQILPAIIPLVSLTAIVPIFLSRKWPNVREFWSFLAGIIKISLLFMLLPIILKGETVEFTVFQVFSSVPFAFKVDAFGLLFAFVSSSLWIVTTLYSIGYMRTLSEHNQTRFFSCFALALSATVGVAFSANLFTLYVFYEILSLSTYPLVAHHQDKEAKLGARKYLIYLLGTSIGFVLPAMIITYQLTGTLTFSEMGVFGQAVPMGTLTILLLLFLFGFGKSGLMPFHAWLPGAMVAPTPVSSLLHAVAVVKVGVFSIVRVLTGIFGIDLLSETSLSTIVCVIASFTVITASLIALSQDNLKRRLAFSTIGQLAYIVLGAGIANFLGVAGSMLHIAMHAFGKITLFFCAGAIYVNTGEKYISKMVGIGRKMPWTMTAFFIGSLSIIGIPLTGGFISKWHMVLGAVESGKLWVLVVYLVSSLLNAAYFLPIVYNAFFCSDKSSLFQRKVKEAPLATLVPPLITATISVILFLYPSFFLKLALLASGG